MAEINLEPGERQKIVSQPDADTDYNIGVAGTNVYLSHRSNGIVNRGKQLVSGDRTMISNLEGSPLFAKNPSTNSDTATVQVDEAGFSLTFQARSSQPEIVGVNNEGVPAATNGYDNVTDSGVDVSNQTSTSEALTPPGRADQVMLRVEGTAAFDVTVSWNNTSETYSSTSGVVDEVVPVYYIDEPVNVTITDTSAGANTVDYDMAVI